MDVLKIILRLKVLRVLRMFKLARSWKKFQLFLTTILNTLSKIASFAVLLIVFIFMFAVLGCELFSNKLKFNRDNEAVNYFNESEPGVVPNSNFDNFFNATISVFIVLANDGWTVIYFDYYRAVGPVKSSIFFISLLVVG